MNETKGQKTSTENVQVFLRIRPANSRELDRNEMNIWSVGKNYLRLNSDKYNGLVKQHKINAPPYLKPCVFNGCFDSLVTNANIYQSILGTITEGSLNGINATLFIYGQTGSG